MKRHRVNELFRSSAGKYFFTLVELLVVIAIIAILAAILMPALSTARERAKESTCLSNLKQIAHQMAIYHDEYNGFPVAEGINMNRVSNTGAAGWKSWYQFFYEVYFKKNHNSMRCPNSYNGGPRFYSGADKGAWGRYGYNNRVGQRGSQYGFDGSVTKMPRPSTICLITDSIYKKDAVEGTAKGYSFFYDYQRVDLRHRFDIEVPYSGAGVMAYVDGHAAGFSVPLDNPGLSWSHPLSRCFIRVVLPTEK